MRLPFARIYQSFTGSDSRPPQRSDILWYGMLLLSALFVLLLMTDGYLFYLSHRRERLPTRELGRNVTLSEPEIDEALRLIDDRDQKFKTLLGGGE